MKNGITGILAVCLIATMNGFAADPAPAAATPAPAAATPAPAVAAPAPVAAKPMVVKDVACFICEKCAKVELKAAKCCGADMTALKVLEIKAGKANCCTCKADCKCKMNPDDPYQCSCGKDVREVSVGGKFACADGKCLALSAEAGTCACGKKMVQVP